MYYETLTDLLNNDPAAYEYFYGLSPEMQAALQQQGGVVLRGQGHQRRVPEIGGKQQAADLLHQLDDRPAVRQAQAAAVQGGGAFRQGAAYGRGGFLDVLGIHKQASFPCVEKSKRQRMRHASSAAAFTRFSRARQARAFWANHA